MATDLSTTNVLLGVLAFTGVVELLLIAAVGIGALLLMRHVATMLAQLERQHLTPAAERVRAILDDVKEVTGNVRARAEQVDTFARWTLRAVQRLGGRP